MACFVPEKNSIAFCPGLSGFKDEMEICVSPEQAVLLGKFYEIMVAANRRINLVSRNPTKTTLIEDQILESLLAQPVLKEFDPERVLDLGSGGGVPGVPLAIMNPDCRFDLLDASLKRTNHLVKTIQTLSLDNTSVIRARVEELSTKDCYKKGFDLILARGVRNLPGLVPYIRNTVRDLGALVVFVGNNEASRVCKFLLPYSRTTRPLLVRSIDTGIPNKSPRRILVISI